MLYTTPPMPHRQMDSSDITGDTKMAVTQMEKLLSKMRASPKNVRFVDLAKVCEHYFGKPRQSSGSHVVHTTPWPGDPRINIQNRKGMAAAYQVRQVLAAIDKLVALRDAGRGDEEGQP